MPDGIEIPIKHEQPKTTLDSLLQIKNEFDTKLKESTDASKKRRYQRQLKVNFFLVFFWFRLKIKQSFLL